MNRTIQQERASFALARGAGLFDRAGVDASELRTAVRAFPALVHMNGLGQAAAFYKGGKRAQPFVYELFSDWLCANGQPLAGHTDLVAAIAACEMQVYMAAQAEALELAEWVKRLVDAHDWSMDSGRGAGATS
jgi:CRISPR-associated protein Cmr5